MGDWLVQTTVQPQVQYLKPGKMEPCMILWWKHTRSLNKWHDMQCHDGLMAATMTWSSAIYVSRVLHGDWPLFRVIHPTSVLSLPMIFLPLIRQLTKLDLMMQVLIVTLTIHLSVEPELYTSDEIRPSKHLSQPFFSPLGPHKDITTQLRAHTHAHTFALTHKLL